jgi:hypothetical protein
MDDHSKLGEESSKAWKNSRETLELMEQFREEHQRKNNRKIDSQELRKWAISKLEQLTEMKHGDSETIAKFKARLEKNKKIDYDEVDFLEDSFFKIQKDVETQIGDKSEILDALISKNIGNPEILNRIKTGENSGTKIDDSDFRYLLFCLHELQKQIIFDTGIVPDGWLPSDLDAKNKDEIMELRQTIEKNTKYIKWGVGALAHDKLTGQKSIRHSKSQHIWD